MRCAARPPPTAKRLPGEGATGPTAWVRVAATAVSSGRWRWRRRRGVRLTLPRLLGGGGGGGDGRISASPPPPPSMGAVAADTLLLRAAAGHLTAANRRLRARLGAALGDARLQVLSAGASTAVKAGAVGWATVTGLATGATTVAATGMRGRRPSGGQWHWRWRRGAGGAPRRRPRRSTRRWSHVWRAVLCVRRRARPRQTSCPQPCMTAAASLTLMFEAGGGSTSVSPPAAVVRQRRCGGRVGQSGVGRDGGDAELEFVRRASARAPHVRHACVDFESTSQSQGKALHVLCTVYACIGDCTPL